MYPEIVGSMVDITAYAMGVGIVSMRRLMGVGQSNAEKYNSMVLDELTRPAYEQFVRDLDDALDTSEPDVIKSVFAQSDMPEELKDFLLKMILDRLE